MFYFKSILGSHHITLLYTAKNVSCMIVIFKNKLLQPQSIFYQHQYPMKPVLYHLINCTICPATYTMLLIFANKIRWIFHGFTCKARELLYATSYIHNYSNMNKYFGSCWLHNGIVANAFCSLVKCIKRNVIRGFFIYNILVQIFKKFVYYDAL